MRRCTRLLLKWLSPQKRPTSDSRSSSSSSSAYSISNISSNITTTISDDDDGGYSTSEFSDREDGDKMMLCGDILEDEIKENKYVSKFKHTYIIDGNLFSADKMADLRKREQSLMEGNKKCYYRCK